MNLQAWSYTTSAQITLRGWHSMPTGKPLLHFLHGNGFCGRVYTPLLELLSADFDLWLCDIQGHGDSDAGARFLGWNRNGELAVEAFQAQRKVFGDVPVYAVAHSLGGVISSLIMAQHPQLFKRAVLLDPVIYTPSLQVLMKSCERLGLTRINKLATRTRARRAHWPDRQAAYASLMGRGAFKGWSSAALTAFVEHALRPAEPSGVQLKCAPELEATIFSSAPQGLWSALGQVQTPLLMMYGAETFPFVMKSAALWQQRNSYVEVEQVQGGHCFMQQYPEMSAQRVSQFLRSASE
ncbi:MAG: alpha/beta hydrolase [Gammaproteobacteria bacterium]|nr:alpha/beta hydrolase [Gammaproteobacteria bacterium]